MEKKLKLIIPWSNSPGVRKMLLCMKLTLVISLVAVLQTWAAVSYSQTTTLSINLKNATVQTVLQQIEDQSEFYFLYSRSLINVDRIVDVQLKDAKITEVLYALFNGADVAYKVDGRQIVLSKKSESSAFDMQQQKSISGKVTDSSGASLPGVSVVVKGTTNGTITDSDGKYSINSVPANSTLQFSFVGMKSQEIVVENKTIINVTLIEDAIGIEEVVAIGYGTQKRATVTGSVVSTKGEDLIKSKTPNVLNSITGRLAGVIVNNRSGEPGRDDPSILIRGRSTTGSSSPLILIDGIETSDFAKINSNDIESMSVLKDASAAIYGARAANGVILVTTKSGKKGVPTFNFDYNQGFSQATRNNKMADSYTFAKVYNEIEIGEGRTAKYSDAELEKFRIGKEEGYTTTNWNDVMTKSLTPQHQANLSVSGGTESVDYYISLGKLGQDGNFNYGTTSLNRYNFRSKINVKASKYIQIGLDVSGRLDDKHYPGNPDSRGIYSHIYLYQPNWTLFWPGTNYLRPNRDSESLVNWVSDNAGWQNEKYKAIESKLHYNIEIPWIKGLSVSGSANYNTGYNYIKRFAKPDFVYYYDAVTKVYSERRSGYGANLAQLQETFNQNTTLTINSQINYAKTIGENKIELMAGYEQMEYDYNFFNAGRTDFPSAVLPQLFAGSSDKSKQSNDGSASSTARQNYFGRATYDYAGKYLAQLIFRYDGSPNFPENKRWGFFPGISLGWRMSEEAFMKELEFVQNLKLRASYGELGNDAVSPFQYLTSYAYNNNYVLGNSDVIGLIQSGVPNPNITWEVAKSTNLGFDATLWKGALGIEFDLFKTKRSNILTKRTAIIPDYTGLVLPDENIGEVENKGFELQLTHQKQINNKLRYTISGNMSYARNKVVFADEAPAAEDYQLATGRPIGAELFYDAIGIYSSQAEVDASPHLAGARPGDIIYRDVNNDSKLNSRDMIRINKTAIPEIVYSLIGTLNYKNLDFSVMFQGQENAETYVKGGASVTDTNPYFVAMSYNLGNFLEWRANDRWSPDNIDATQPRGSIENFNNNTLQSTHWLMNAGFLRLKNLEIGYRIPSDLCQKIGLKSLRAYASGNNLLIIYDHMKDLGFDPETSDYWYYPQQRTFNVGINLTF